MFSNPLIIMSLTGSAVFLLYLLAYPLEKKYFSLKWRYRLLKIAVVFYLLPLPWFKYQIIEAVSFFFPKFREWGNPVEIINMKYSYSISPDLIQFTSDFRRLLLVALVMVCFSLALLFRQAVRYRKWKTAAASCLEKPAERESEIFTDIKKEMGIKKDVRLACSEACISPAVSGIRRPVVVFPTWKSGMGAKEYRYIFQHELAHVKNHDLLIRYAGLLVMALHWYNPLAYFLFHEICAVSEMYCDSLVVRGKGDDVRREYGGLILTLATQDTGAGKGNFFAAMANSRNKRIYKRRILEMKRKETNHAVLAVVVAALLCVAGGMTSIFAYDAPHGVEGYMNDSEIEDGDHYFIPDCLIVEEDMSLPADHFFTDEDNHIYIIDVSGTEQQAACSHDYSIHGTYTDHNKDGTGGCVVRTYDAYKCSKCPEVKKGALKNEITYKPCSHYYKNVAVTE